MALKIGDKVRLRSPRVAADRYRTRKPTARRIYDDAVIRSFLTEVPGGVLLDRNLAGFRCWNRKDLVRA